MKPGLAPQPAISGRTPSAERQRGPGLCCVRASVGAFKHPSTHMWASSRLYAGSGIPSNTQRTCFKPRGGGCFVLVPGPAGIVCTEIRCAERHATVPAGWGPLNHHGNRRQMFVCSGRAGINECLPSGSWVPPHGPTPCITLKINLM